MHAVWAKKDKDSLFVKDIFVMKLNRNLFAIINTIIKRKFQMNIPFYTMTKKGLKIWQKTLNNSLMTHLHQIDYLKPYTPLKAEHFE